MKTNCFLIAASLLFAMVFMFSCSSSDDNPPPPKGGVINSDNGPYTGCKIMGICSPVPSDGADEVCQSTGGTIDNSCVFRHCKIGDICTPMAEATAATCELMSGKLVSASECDNYEYGGSSSSGGGSSSSGGGGSSSSGGGGSSSSAGTSYIGYCDFGYPQSEGSGGCFLIEKMSDCNLEWGIFSPTKCGRTDLTYCLYTDGGCYSVPNTTAGKSQCTTDYGSVKTECPASSLDVAFYCFDAYDDGECDKIHGSIGISASECASEGGSIVKREDCVAEGAPINN